MISFKKNMMYHIFIIECLKINFTLINSYYYFLLIILLANLLLRQQNDRTSYIKCTYIKKKTTSIVKEKEKEIQSKKWRG